MLNLQAFYNIFLFIATVRMAATILTCMFLYIMAKAVSFSKNEAFKKNGTSSILWRAKQGLIIIILLLYYYSRSPINKPPQLIS